MTDMREHTPSSGVSISAWRPALPTGHRPGGLTGVALATLLAAGPVYAEPPRDARTGGLTVGILDLAAAPGLMPRRPAPAERPAWRTSFGSERTTEAPPPVPASDPLAALATTDAVLIQGVKAAAPLRRFFPPRTWRLIVSRKIIPPDAHDPLMTRAELPAATAIAVKARQTLRVTARAHALRLDAVGQGAIEPAAELPAAATAIRLVEGGRTLWLASVALPPSCGDGEEICAARRNLDAWREAQRGRGELTVVGGRMIARPAEAAAPTDEPPSAAACTSHGIDSDFDWQTLPTTGETISPDAQTGCIVIVRLAE